MRSIKDLRSTIREITQAHLKKFNTFVFGQNLLGVGQVDGTLPSLKNLKHIVDLPMADVAGGGIVTGAALLGIRPIYIIRYQGYNWFNMIFIINYACKSKEIWKISCPIWIRGIANEGCIGPVASSSHVSIFYKMPGIKIYSPMTSDEYRQIYNLFLRDDCPYYISEHRKSFGISVRMKNIYFEKPKIVVILNSVTRLNANTIISYFKKININVGIIHLYKLKPFTLNKKERSMIINSQFGVLLCDNDYEDGLIALLSFKICKIFGNKIIINSCGLINKTSGNHPNSDVLPPNASKIIEKIKKIIN